MGTSFTTSCDEDGFPVGGISPALVDDAISMSVNIGTDTQSRPAFCDEDGNPLDRMPVVSINMINISSGRARPNEEEDRPTSRQRISMEDESKAKISGESSILTFIDPAAAILEESRMSCYREYRERNHLHVRRNWGNELAAEYIRHLGTPSMYSRDNIEGVNMVRNGMTVAEVELYRK